MRALACAAFVILAMFAAIVAFAPASLVDSRVQAATGGQVRLATTEGTLWRGRSIAVVGDGVARIPVAWQLDPWSLATGEARITLDPPADSAAAPRGRMSLSADRVRVEQLALTLPAAAIAAHIAVPGLRAGGEVELRAEDLAIASAVERGTLRLDWRGARLAVAGQPAMYMGTVTAALTAREGALAGPLTARGGAIRIDGETSLAPDGGRLAARLVPEATATAADRAAIARLGAPAADGSVSIAFARSVRR